MFNVFLIFNAFIILSHHIEVHDLGKGQSKTATSLLIRDEINLLKTPGLKASEMPFICYS